MCKPDLAKGKICPDLFPDTPEWAGIRQVCASGCYLLHPEDERQARFNKERVALIPDLQADLDEFRHIATKGISMIEALTVDKDQWRSLFEDEATQRAKLQGQLEDAWTGTEKAYGVLAGIGVGVVLTVAGVVTIVLVL